MAVRALPWQCWGLSQGSTDVRGEIQPASGLEARPIVARLHLEVCGGRLGKQRRGRRVARRSFRATFDGRKRERALVVSRLFDPEDFDPAKLSVSLENSSSYLADLQPNEFVPRTYTLTHSDVTGELQLSIGPCYNQTQLDSWYTRLMRDEIVAEWKAMKGQFSLHVHCHISGGHRLLAPAALRNRIFQREMPLVLQAIRHGDGVLLARHPALDASTVWVHFHSVHKEFDRADCWGPLFYASISDGLKSAAAQPRVPPLFDNGSFVSYMDRSWDSTTGSRLVENDVTSFLRHLRVATISSEKAATILLTLSTLFLLQALIVT